MGYTRDCSCGEVKGWSVLTALCPHLQDQDESEVSGRSLLAERAQQGEVSESSAASEEEEEDGKGLPLSISA